MTLPNIYQYLHYHFSKFLHNLCQQHQQEEPFTDTSEIVQGVGISVELVIRQLWTSSNGKGKGENYHLE